MTAPVLTELSRVECFRLLERVELGRVGVSIDALPVILPVFITALDDSIVFRTVAGSRLPAASLGAIVAVEADSFDAASGRGWSVLVRGAAHDLVDPVRADAARARLGEAWPDAPRADLVEVTADLVTGRRLG